MANILLIDDDVDIFQILSFKFGQVGHEVMQATDGQLGIQMFRDTRPHIVLLDVMIPVFDGFYVLREIRSEDTQTPILMLTAKGQEQDIVRGLETGANDYVTKPFSPTEVVSRCNRWLAQS